MAAKLRDGLFIGDADASLDAEFLDLNKISHIVNVASREVPNKWAARGVAYMCFPWIDNPECVLFEHSLRSLTDLVEFVDDASRHGQGVLVCSVRGQGRAAVAGVALLMYKYRWSFEKAYDFVVSKKADIDINRGFVHQLFILDKRLVAACRNYKLGTCKTDVLIPTSSAASQAGPAMGASDVAASAWGLPVFAPIVFVASPQSQSADSADPTVSATGPGEDAIDWRFVEAERREGWDAEYVRACQTFVNRQGIVIHQSGTAAPLSKGTYEKLYSFALNQVNEDLSEELLMVYSYVNGKVTLTSLPGPYPDASRQVKPFSIRFNPDLYLHHLFEEPDGRVVSMVTRSSGKVHSPLPPSPNAPLQDRGVAASLGGARRSQPSETEEDTDHIAIPQPRFGVLKGGKTHDSRRRKPAPSSTYTNTDLGSAARVHPAGDQNSNAALVQRVDLDRGREPAAASAEQRLHTLLSGIQYKSDPSSSTTGVLSSDKALQAMHPLQPESKHCGAKRLGGHDGELTDTSSDEDKAEPPARFRGGKTTTDRPQADRAEAKSDPRDSTLYTKSISDISTKVDAGESALSLQDIASMRLEPAFHVQSSSILSIDGDEDPARESDVIHKGSIHSPQSLWDSDRKLSAFDQNTASAKRAENSSRSMLTEEPQYSERPTSSQSDFISRSLLRAKLLADDAIGKSGKTLLEEQQLRADALKMHDKRMAWTLSSHSTNNGEPKKTVPDSIMEKKVIQPSNSDKNAAFESSKGKPVRVSHSRFNLDVGLDQMNASSSRSVARTGSVASATSATDAAVYRHGSPAAVRMSPRRSSGGGGGGGVEGRAAASPRDKPGSGSGSRPPESNGVSVPRQGSGQERDRSSDADKGGRPPVSSRSNGTPQRERSSLSGTGSSGLFASSRTSLFSTESSVGSATSLQPPPPRPTTSSTGSGGNSAGHGGMPTTRSSTPTRVRGDGLVFSVPNNSSSGANRRPSTPTRAWR